MAEVILIKHRRTGMYVARQEAPKSASYRMPCANWRWVRDKADATRFDRYSVIHPVIQMDIEASAMPVDLNGDFVPGVL